MCRVYYGLVQPCVCRRQAVVGLVVFPGLCERVGCVAWVLILLVFVFLVRVICDQRPCEHAECDVEWGVHGGVFDEDDHGTSY